MGQDKSPSKKQAGRWWNFDLQLGVMKLDSECNTKDRGCKFRTLKARPLPPKTRRRLFFAALLTS